MNDPTLQQTLLRMVLSARTVNGRVERYNKKFIINEKRTGITHPVRFSLRESGNTLFFHIEIQT